MARSLISCALVGVLAGCSELGTSTAVEVDPFADPMVERLTPMTAAIAINDAGTVLGRTGTQMGLWRAGAFTPLGYAADGICCNDALALNSRDAAVGSVPVAARYRALDGTESPISSLHAASWRNGTFTDLGTLPGDNASLAVALNDLGDVVGSSRIWDGDWETWDVGGRAVLWRGGAAPIVLAPLPGDSWATVADINNRGQAIGTSYPSGQIVLWQDGMRTTLRDLPINPGDQVQAVAINDNGQLVGTHCSKGLCRAFLWHAGQTRWLDFTGPCLGSQAAAIDRTGRVVGAATRCGSEGSMRAVMWSAEGKLTELAGVRGYISSDAKGINEAGQIVGSANVDGTSRGRVAVTWKAP